MEEHANDDHPDEHDEPHQRRPCECPTETVNVFMPDAQQYAPRNLQEPTNITTKLNQGAQSLDGVRDATIQWDRVNSTSSACPASIQRLRKEDPTSTRAQLVRRHTMQTNSSAETVESSGQADLGRAHQNPGPQTDYSVRSPESSQFGRRAGRGSEGSQFPTE